MKFYCPQRKSDKDSDALCEGKEKCTKDRSKGCVIDFIELRKIQAEEYEGQYFREY